MIAYTPTPIQELRHNVLATAGIRLLVKREDLNNPDVSGNKFWKLKFNLEEAIGLGKNCILTFGGAYSNHIYATAAAASACGIKSIGIIRGEEITPLNPTLTFARACGMTLHFVSRADYREKTTPALLNMLREKFGDFYLVPEGGTNALAVKGCVEFAATQLAVDFDYLCLPVGTGGTMTGIIMGTSGTKEIIGVSVLKNGGFLAGEIDQLLKNFSEERYGNWSVLTSYDHGGYARVTDELLAFIRMMRVEHDLPLDPVYTGKLLWAVLEEARRGRFRRGSTVLVLHTGGLQGAAALLA